MHAVQYSTAGHTQSARQIDPGPAGPRGATSWAELGPGKETTAQNWGQVFVRDCHQNCKGIKVSTFYFYLVQRILYKHSTINLLRANWPTNCKAVLGAIWQ